MHNINHFNEMFWGTEVTLVAGDGKQPKCFAVESALYV